jgi:hypothetical protein
MQLYPINQDQSSPTKIDENIAKVLYHVNQLSPFIVTDQTIIEWTKSIQEILPNIDNNDLRALLNDFKTDAIHYDNKLGIQNIFIGLKKKFGLKYGNNKHVI